MLEGLFASFFVSGLVCLTQQQRVSEKADFEWALEKANLSKTQAAQIMRLTLPDLCNALAGFNKLDGWRIAMMPASFRAWYALAVLRRFGFPDEIHTAIKATAVVDQLRKDQ